MLNSVPITVLYTQWKWTYLPCGLQKSACKCFATIFANRDQFR